MRFNCFPKLVHIQAMHFSWLHKLDVLRLAYLHSKRLSVNHGLEHIEQVPSTWNRGTGKKPYCRLSGFFCEMYD